MKPCASTEGFSRVAKIGIITIGLLRDLSEIKLKRTDTTLDLSQTVIGAVSNTETMLRSLNNLGFGTYRQRELKKKRRRRPEMGRQPRNKYPCEGGETVPQSLLRQKILLCNITKIIATSGIDMQLLGNGSLHHKTAALRGPLLSSFD